MALHLEQPAPPRDDAARQELAAAVAARQAAEADHVASVAALAVTEEAVFALRRQLDAAEEALREAPDLAAAHLVAVAKGSAGPPPATTRECRERQADLADELLAAHASRDALRQLVAGSADSRQGLRAMRLRDSAVAVMRSEVAPVVAGLAAELQAVQHRAATLGRVLEWMVGIGAAEMTADLKAAIGRHTCNPPCDWFREKGAPDPASAWQAVLARLEDDPEAPAATPARG